MMGENSWRMKKINSIISISFPGEPFIKIIIIGTVLLNLGSVGLMKQIICGKFMKINWISLKSIMKLHFDTVNIIFNNINRYYILVYI